MPAPRLLPLLSFSLLSGAACTGGPGATQQASQVQQAQLAQLAVDRTAGLAELTARAGAPILLEVGAAGDLRVLTASPEHPIAGRAGDPAAAALEFVASSYRVFQLDPAAAAQFAVARVDADATTGLRHVALDRIIDGVPVFHGGVSVHMDAENRVFRALGNDAYRAGAPVNRVVLAPIEAAAAAGRALGVALAPVPAGSSGEDAVFTSPGTSDPLYVALRIFHVAPGDDRLAYQVTVSWLDGKKQPRYELVLVDAADGAPLARHSLVNDFTGRVFHVKAQPTAGMTIDTRTVVSFNGNATASPSGWVGAARTTAGNNVIAATDLNADNVIGAGEVQPFADLRDSFDFPFDPTQNASNFRPAAVTSAFFLANDWHDRTYLLGFTEGTGNFQVNNFGRGGVQSDPVLVDVQDGSGTSNATFATPPDGTSPRMTLFVFTMNGGPTEDSAFDPSVIYHENTHGMSNHLVAAGAPACLGGLQSGGMGEGWSDFVAASFLSNPVIGAYVSGNAATGVRRVSMAASPFTFNDIRTGVLPRIHDVGELWAATLWDVRRVLGRTATEQIVVGGMKLTPCSPTMLQARDAIMSADLVLNGGSHRCALWNAFAARGMGLSAVSPDHNATVTIVAATDVPPDCSPHFLGSASPAMATIDNGTACTSLTVPATAGSASVVRLDLAGTHTYRAILRGTLTHNATTVDAFPTDTFMLGSGAISLTTWPVAGLTGNAAGTWTLCLVDTDACGDTGVLTSWSVHD